MTGSDRFPWLCSLPSNAIADQDSPETLDNLVEFENLTFTRLFTEWARSAHPLTIDSISQLLSSRLLAQRPVDTAGVEWSDRKLRLKNRQLADLYRQFKEGPLVELRSAINDSGAAGLHQEICLATVRRLTERGLDSLPFAAAVMAIASPVTAIGLALDHLAELEDYGWPGARTIARGPARSLLAKVWGLTDGVVRQAVASCQQAEAGLLPPTDDLLVLANALMSYGELAEQLLLTLPVMCNAAIDWLRTVESGLEPRPPQAAVRDARAESLAKALLCTEIALRQSALSLYALAPAFAPLAATAISAIGISDLLSGLPSPMTHAGAAFSRTQAHAMLGSQLLAAEYDRMQIDSYRQELAQTTDRLARLPDEPSSYRSYPDLIARLQVLRGLPDAPVGSSGFTFAGQLVGVHDLLH